MGDRPPQFSETHVKHLEMIQAVITRLGNDSFLVKGWAVTVSGVFLGLAINGSRPALALIGLVPTLMFWSLDTYYLRSERLFRVFYDHARRQAPGYSSFAMDGTGPAFISSLSEVDRDKASWWKTAWRPTLRWLYLALLLAGCVTALVIASGSDNERSGCPESQAYFVGDSPRRC